MTSRRGIEGYEIDTAIGEGEITVVYAARGPDGRGAALKTARPEVRVPKGDPHWREAFLRAVEGYRKVSHPHVVAVLAESFEDVPVLVTELVPGTPLGQHLAWASLSTAQRLQIALDLGEALAFAHRLGTAHLGLKPANVLLTGDGTVKITDFQTSRLALPESLPGGPPSRPDARYRAPEQVFGRPPDARSDQFVFGILLCELLLGRHPFDGETPARVARKVLNARPGLGRPGATPSRLAPVLERLLRKDPAERYASLEEALTALTAATRGMGSEPDVATGVSAEEPALLVVDGDGERRALPIRHVFSIGRKVDNDLCLNDPQISRRHARIIQQRAQFVLEDLGSRFGTRVNGRQVTRVELSSGDVLQLGEARAYRISFFFQSDLDAGSTAGAPLARAAASAHALDLLLDVVCSMSCSLGLMDVLNVVMDSALQLTDADRGFLALRDKDGVLHTRVTRSLHPDFMVPDEGAISRSVRDRCLATEGPVVIPDVNGDPSIAGHTSVSDLALRAIYCVPLSLGRSAPGGLLYLDSQRPAPARDERFVEILAAFGIHASLAIENARLYELATRDSLTGLYLPRLFHLRLDEEIERARRYSRPLSVMALDVDLFKRVNDRYGHAIGDSVLRRVTAALAGAVRSSDMVARTGGEEFMILAPETPLAEAGTLARRLLDAIRKIPWLDVAAGLRVTVSIGAAELGHDETAAKLCARADAALYRAKTTGRDRLVFSRKRRLCASPVRGKAGKRPPPRKRARRPQA